MDFGLVAPPRDCGDTGMSFERAAIRHLPKNFLPPRSLLI
jgi:hypothetical protein